uniref:CSON009093 protein n=1 Tax=Culicoides sonorensis TaxID=179676 RepID=A0A336LD74_CULSO
MNFMLSIIILLAMICISSAIPLQKQNENLAIENTNQVEQSLDNNKNSDDLQADEHRYYGHGFYPGFYGGGFGYPYGGYYGGYYPPYYRRPYPYYGGFYGGYPPYFF